jgi:preprotein translocase subunit SecG
MRIYLLIPSVLLLVFAIALPLLVVMGGGSNLGNEYDREQSVNAKNSIERALNRSFYWMADNRPICGIVGFVGVVVSIVWK